MLNNDVATTSRYNLSHFEDKITITWGSAFEENKITTHNLSHSCPTDSKQCSTNEAMSRCLTRSEASILRVHRYSKHKHHHIKIYLVDLTKHVNTDSGKSTYLPKWNRQTTCFMTVPYKSTATIWYEPIIVQFDEILINHRIVIQLTNRNLTYFSWLF